MTPNPNALATVDAESVPATAAVQNAPAKKAKAPAKKQRDETPTEVYILKGFFPPDEKGKPSNPDEPRGKLPAGTFQEVPAWMVVKLASRQIVMDADQARQEIENGEPEQVLRRERGIAALARSQSMRTAPESDNWLEDD